MPIPFVEKSEKEITQNIIKGVKEIKEVKGCHRVSVRMTGKRFYVTMHVSLDNNLRFADVHKIASDIERKVKSIVPNARVTIHTEPIGNDQVSIWELVKEIAEGVPGSRGVHNIHIQKINGNLYIDLHLEVSANLTVKQAHDISIQVEREIKTANPNIFEITVHMESASDFISRELTGIETELKSHIEHITKEFSEIKYVHGIKIRKIDDSLHIVLRCHFDPNINMKDAHEISQKIEDMIRSLRPNITRIDIHEEPA